MCKILIGFKLKKSQNKEFEKIIKAQEDSLSDQPHGISALIVNKNNKIEVKKELSEYKKVFNWVYRKIKNAKIVAIHTRQATDGGIDEDNLHFFKIGEYFFAHNGIIGNYSNYSLYLRGNFFPVGKSFSVTDDIDEENEVKAVEEALEKEAKGEEKEMSDSYKFLLNIPKPITELSLKKEIEEKKFVGIGAIFDEKRKKFFFASTREAKAHTDFKNYIILYSYDPVNVLSKYRKISGFPIILKDETKKLKRYILPAGIYKKSF